MIEIARRAQTADREILDRARGLHAVVRIGRHIQLAERIAFGTEAISHSHQPLAISHSILAECFLHSSTASCS